MVHPFLNPWFWVSAVVFGVVWLAAGLSAGRRRGAWFLLLAAVVTAAVMWTWVPRMLDYRDQVVRASVPTPEPLVVEKVVEVLGPEPLVTGAGAFTATQSIDSLRWEVFVQPETITKEVTSASPVLMDTAWVKELVSAPASVVWVPCAGELGLCVAWNAFANGNGKPVAMKVLVCPMPQGARLIDGEEVDGEVPVGEWQILGITVRPCPKPAPTPISAPAAKPAVAPKFDPLSVVAMKDGVKLDWVNCTPAEPSAVCWNTYKNGPGTPVWMKVFCYQDGVRLVDSKEVTGLPAGEHPAVLGITARPCK